MRVLVHQCRRAGVFGRLACRFTASVAALLCVSKVCCCCVKCAHTLVCERESARACVCVCVCVCRINSACFVDIYVYV